MGNRFPIVAGFSLFLGGCHHAVISHPPQLVGHWLSDTDPERDGYKLYKDGSGDRRGAMSTVARIVWRCSDNTLQVKGSEEAGDFADYAYSIKGTHLTLTHAGKERHFTNDRDINVPGTAASRKLSSILRTVEATKKISKEDQDFVLKYTQRPFSIVNAGALLNLEQEVSLGLYDRQKLLTLIEENCTKTARPGDATFYALMYHEAIPFAVGKSRPELSALRGLMMIRDAKQISKEEWSAYDEFLMEPTARGRAYFGECAVEKRELSTADLARLRQLIASQMITHSDPQEKSYWDFVNRVVTKHNTAKP